MLRRRVLLRQKFESLKATDVPRWVIQRFASSKQADDWTLQCFFMLVCNALLFPSSTTLVSGADYYICKDLGAVKSLNWCSAVVDDIQMKTKKWKDSSQ